MEHSLVNRLEDEQETDTVATIVSSAREANAEDEHQIRPELDRNPFGKRKGLLGSFLMKQQRDGFFLEIFLLLEQYGRNSARLKNHLQHLFQTGVPYRVLLAAVHMVCRKQIEEAVKQPHQSHAYEDHITMFASYLLSCLIPKRNKLDCLRVLVMTVLRKPRNHGDSDEVLRCEDITDEALQFVISPPGIAVDHQWQPMWNDEGLELLFWELRAVCRRQWELLAQRRRDCLAHIARTGEAAADFITNGASWMERVLLSKSVPLIHTGIDNVGNFLKQILTPAEQDALMVLGQDNNNIDQHFSQGKPAVVLLIYTDAAKRATSEAKESVRVVLHGIRDTSTEGIHWVAHRMDEDKVGERLITDPSSRAVLAAWGKVGLASLGATAVLSEAMLEATKSIGYKLATVTAHVVEHKYGTLAGQVVQDSCDATGNVFRTVTYVMTFKATVITKFIVRNTVKLQYRKQLHEKEERLCSTFTETDNAL